MPVPLNIERYAIYRIFYLSMCQFEVQGIALRFLQWQECGSEHESEREIAVRWLCGSNEEESHISAAAL